MRPCGCAGEVHFATSFRSIQADLPVHCQQYDSENLDFYFEWVGFRRGDQCIAIAQLPDYAIGRIHIGQWIAKEDRTLWEAEFPAGR